MKNSKTIETLKKYYSLVGSEKPTQEEKEFVWHFELELAKSILQDFDKETVSKLAQILLVCSNPLDGCYN